MLKGFYYSGDCSDPVVAHQIKKVFLGNLLTEFEKAELCVKAGRCSLQSVRVVCGQTDEQAKKTNRWKRDVWQLAEREDLELEFEITLDIDEELNNTKEVLHQFLETIQNLNWDSDEFDPAPATEASYVAAAAHNGISEDLHYLLGPSFPDFANETYSGSVVFTDDWTELTCGSGSVLNNETCVLCSPGTFYDIITRKCWDCPLGEYQEYEGRTDCTKCPDGTSTEDRGSRDGADCKGICSPGSFSDNGLETCMVCPLGTYQEFAGQSSCLTCPDGTTTADMGSVKVSDCRDMCVPGSYSKSGLAPCDPCPKGYYQSLSGQTVCYECPANLSTRIEGAKDVLECKDLDPCANASACANGARCIRVGRNAQCICEGGFEGQRCEMDINECEQGLCRNSVLCINGEGSFECICNSGFEGKLCELEINECTSQPCQNNGTCMDKVNNYTCICTAGYEGQNCEQEREVCFHDTACVNGQCVFQVDANSSYCDCEPGYEGIDCSVDVNECMNVSCLNNGSCVNGKSSFECVCSGGYTGQFCEVDIDDCEGNQCSVNSLCRDLVGGYECICDPGYGGTHCETELDPDFLLHFPTRDIGNMATLTLRTALSEVTVSAWVQTTDSVHSSTPLSYAVAGGSGADNALTISDCSGLHVYVNNEMVVTDVGVADGQWHHLAFTWASDSGSWNLYKDGDLLSNGTNLKPADVIQKGGTIVIGQEQDSVGGSFSPFETFTGNISRVNIWNSSFASSNITRLCNLEDNIPGKVVAWPDFLKGIKGDVNVINDERPTLMPHY